MPDTFFRSRGRASEDLLTAQVLASIGELAGAVAHEVKNPLAGISGAMQILKDAMPKDDPRIGVVEEVMLQVDRIDRLIRDLLAFSQPWTPRRVESDVHDILRGVVDRLQRQTVGVEIVLEGQGECRPKVDRLLFDLAMTNIIRNAAESGARTVGIRCRADAHAGACRIDVEDQGPGMPPEVLDKLFKPFFTTKPKGTGLGLAVAKRVIDAHGGAVSVDSAPGRGTRVTIMIPIGGDLDG